ncbi:hypothetical protein B0T24DRAFT_668121 [Lasiosphaeria ovina]|uniref:Uncharacterized protein n=1 Tax=Lasiosphaeria ovina TaxID=92902 RepID=A0AAE0K7E0_9PEZI|nr:hypothetical protein B0T24DRAFT_668121 [Lasiosphaeria ovina]
MAIPAWVFCCVLFVVCLSYLYVDLSPPTRPRARARARARILFAGLYNAAKPAMAMRSAGAGAGPRGYRQLGVITTSPLGLAAAAERMRGREIESSAIDLGCGAAVAECQGRYRYLFGATELVYFVVDARWPLDRLEVVADELRALRAAEGLEGVPSVPVASHGDGPGAAPEEFIRDFICDRLRLPQDQVSA